MASTHFIDSERTSPTGFGASAATGFTICGWVNANTPDYQVVVWLHEAGGDWLEIVTYRSSGSGLDFILFVASGIEVECTQGEWTFFVASISNNTASIRISTDGQTLSDAVTGSVGAGWDIDRISLGGRASWEMFAHAELHHVRVFVRVLTEDEVLAELTSTAPFGSSWAAWELEDTKLNDYSGNSRHLTGDSGTLTVGSHSPPQPNNTATICSSF
jgi:hypothetical protein